MSSGDPDPQVPPKPERSPEQAQQELQHGNGAATGGAAGPSESGEATQRFDLPAAPQPYQGDPSQHAGSAPQFGASAPFGAEHPPTAPAPSTAPHMAHSGPDVPMPAPAPGYSPGADPTAATTGKKRKKSKLPLILSLSAVGVVLLLVVIGAFVIANINKNQYGPETTAQEYMDAVAAGDLAAAQDVTVATVPNGANESLVTPEVFAASSTSIEDVQVGDADINDDTATMTATYTLDGQDYELPLTAQKTGRQGLFFDQWALDPPVMQTLSMNLVQTADATMNGVPVDLASGQTEYAVMPGTYEIMIPDTKYTNEGSSSITVGFAPSAEPQPATLNVAITMTDVYTEDVEKAVRDQLDACLESDQLETDCGFFSRDSFSSKDEKETYDSLKTDGIDFTMTEEPTITVSDFGVAGTGSFYTDSDEPGEVEAEVESEDGTTYTLTSELRPSGTVSVEGETVEITFFYNG